MDTSVISTDDMDYLAQQSAGNLNIILSGMTALMDDNDSKVSMLENQTWYQRMSRTISGKNKMTQQEIQQNHDKINLYMSQAMAELFNQNCIDHQVILSLGNRLNEIYEDHIQLKQMLGAFVSKLNEKIESIDNFHMLTTEINQKVYSNDIPIVSVSKIMSQLDVRTVNDGRKMDILVCAMKEAGIINSGEVLFSKLLCDLLEVSEADAGIFSLFYSNIKDEYMSEIISDVLLEYYSLPQKIRRMKNRKVFVEKLLSDRQIDLGYGISLEELYSSMIEAYANSIVQAAIEEKEDKIYEKYLKFKEYYGEVCDFLLDLGLMVSSWNPEFGEFLNVETIEEYSLFMTNVKEAVNPDSPMGRSLKTNVCNISAFFQKVSAKYPSIRISEIEDYSVNNNGAINFGAFDEECNEYDKYYSFWSAVNESTVEVFETIEKEVSKNYFSLEHMLEYLNDGPVSLFSSAMINCFLVYYATLTDNIEAMIGEEYSNFEEIYDMAIKYPIDYSEEEYASMFMRKFDYDRPYMVLASSSEDTDLENADIAFLLERVKDGYSSICLKVFNYPYEYTVHMEEIENSCIDVGFGSEKAFEVEFGDWDDNGALEIHIWKLNKDYKMHNARVKFSLKEEPLCAALLSLW